MTAKSMTGLEKAAVLLNSLPAAVADRVLRHMEAKHAGFLGAELEKLKTDPELSIKLTQVLDEAAQVLDDAAKNKKASAGKTPVAADPEKPGADGDKASHVDIRLDGKPDEKAPPPPAPDARAEPLRALASMPPQVLASALDGENARTISLLINCLDLEVAGEVYKRLSPGKRKEVSQRFTEQAPVNEELVNRIAQAVVKKCQSLRDSPTAPNAEVGAREKRVAALLRGLERTERTEMLTMLGQADADLVGRVKALLYQFEDITLMENTSVQKLLAEVDGKSLALALSGAPPEIESKLLANLSKRAQAALREEIELIGKVPAAKARQGRQTLVEAIQRLDERGDLILIES